MKLKLKLHIQILIAIALGAVCGLLLGEGAVKKGRAGRL